ncbi:MAG: hypothetical protein LBV47_08305, partial [Bacteroidales bacterium]|jgi:hypothetical protein|nr:hypothetical protein [Bacteroidales bacterium]
MELITIREYENGGKIQQYQAVDTSAGDYPKVFACCDYFARRGAQVQITPRFNATTVNVEYAEVYASLKNTHFWGRCPDFNVNGLWYEHEGYEETKDFSDPHKRANTFSWMLNRGLKQSDRVIVDDCGVGRRWARKTIYNRICFEHQNITEVYIRTAEGLELLYKREAGLT